MSVRNDFPALLGLERPVAAPFASIDPPFHFRLGWDDSMGLWRSWERA